MSSDQALSEAEKFKKKLQKGGFEIERLGLKPGVPPIKGIEGAREDLEQAEEFAPDVSTLDEAQKFRDFVATRKAEERQAIGNLTEDDTPFFEKQIREQGFNAGISTEVTEVRNPFVRADIQLSDKLEEKREKWLSKFPGGDFIQVKRPEIEGREKIFVRTNPNEDFVALDSDEFTSIDVIGDFLPEAPNIAVSVLLAGKGKVITESLKQMIGEAGVETIKEASESVREVITGADIQQERFVENLSQIGIGSSFAAVGNFLGFVPAKTADVVTKRGLTNISPQGKKAIRAAKRLKFKTPLTVGQISDSNVIKTMEGQSRQLVDTFKKYDRAQKTEALRVLSQLREPELNKLFESSLEEYNQTLTKDVLNLIRPINKSLLDMGTEFKDAVASYEQISGFVTNRAYANARALGDADYDESIVIAAVNNLKSGLKAPAKKIEEAPENISRETLESGDKAQKTTNVLRETIGAGEAAEEGAEETIQLQQIVPVVNKIIDQIEKVDFEAFKEGPFEIDGKTVSKLDVLRYWRSQLFKIKQSPLAGASFEDRQAIEQARSLYGAITETLRNPISEDRAIVEAYKKADSIAAQRFKTLEQVFVKEALQTEEPTSLVRKFIKPGNFDQISFMKQSLEDTAKLADDFGVDASKIKKWGEIQESFMGELISEGGEFNIFNLPETLNKYPRRELDLLIPKEDQPILKEMAKQIQRVRLINVDDVLVRQDRVFNQISSILDNNNSAAIRVLADRVKKNPDSVPSRTIRTAAIDNIIRNVVVISEEGTREIIPEAIDQQIKTLNRKNALGLLKAEDVKTLKSVADFLRTIPKGKDFGTSLARAEAVASMREVFSPADSGISGLTTFAEAYGTARVFTSEKFKAFMLGDPDKKPLDPRGFRVLTSQVMADIVRDLQQEDEFIND